MDLTDVKKPSTAPSSEPRKKRKKRGNSNCAVHSHQHCAVVRAVPSWATFNAFHQKSRIVVATAPGGLVPRLTERQQMAMLMKQLSQAPAQAPSTTLKRDALIQNTKVSQDAKENINPSPANSHPHDSSCKVLELDELNGKLHGGSPIVSHILVENAIEEDLAGADGDGGFCDTLPCFNSDASVICEVLVETSQKDADQTVLACFTHPLPEQLPSSSLSLHPASSQPPLPTGTHQHFNIADCSSAVEVLVDDITLESHYDAAEEEKEITVKSDTVSPPIHPTQSTINALALEGIRITRSKAVRDSTSLPILLPPPPPAHSCFHSPDAHDDGAHLWHQTHTDKEESENVKSSSVTTAHEVTARNVFSHHEELKLSMPIFSPSSSPPSKHSLSIIDAIHIEREELFKHHHEVTPRSHPPPSSPSSHRHPLKEIMMSSAKASAATDDRPVSTRRRKKHSVVFSDAQMDTMRLLQDHCNLWKGNSVQLWNDMELSNLSPPDDLQTLIRSNQVFLIRFLGDLTVFIDDF